MGKSRRFINSAKKKAGRNFDAHKLDKLQNTLQEYSIGSVREKTITDMGFSTTNNVRNPDLILGKVIIIEHDTVKIHGELGYENNRTLRRNGDYMATGRSFAVINEDLCKTLGLDEGALAVYLYYHKAMEINALQEAESRIG